MEKINELLLKYKMLTINLKRIDESVAYNRLAKLYNLKEKNIVSNIENAEKDINAYDDNLTEYINNHLKYEQNMSQNKFFMGAILEIRDLAEQGFKCLNQVYKTTKNQNKKNELTEVSNRLKNITNNLLETVRTILEADDKFQDMMQKHHTDYIEKYNLKYID